MPTSTTDHPLTGFPEENHEVFSPPSTLPSLERSRATASRGCAFLVMLGTLAGAWITGPARAEERWFPDQKIARGLVRTIREDQLPEPGVASRMMIQSVAGLAAKAVNEGRGDELVWVTTANPDIEGWLARFLEHRPAPADRGIFGPWELVDRYRKAAIIKGYILYRLDRSGGKINDSRPGMDCSVNVATSLAPVVDGVIIDETLELEAKRHGLARLLDARDKTQQWCFLTHKDRFNRRLLCTQDPKKPHLRDLAIAQRALTIFGDDPPLREALAWLEPLSPILGWNGGDEFATTRASTAQGHIQTATDWCMNLPVLMAGSQGRVTSRASRLDPHGIDWNDRRSAVSFVQTDGDNVQWLEGNFFGSPSYWSNPDRGRVPFGWTGCFAHLTQLCPDAVDRAVAEQRPNDALIEWGGGYFYPDLFARDRPDRWALLARHARRTWSLMKASGTTIIGFNVSRLDTADARKAYQVFAAETDGLLAILVFQYSPYEAGAGSVVWVKDRNGIDVPVISARYAIWEHTNERPRSGTPAKIAREIRESAKTAASQGVPRYDWVITHAWSYFRKAPGTVENAENLPQANATARGGVRGYTPVRWCAERLPGEIRVVRPEELAWRIRMEHDPEQTRRLLFDYHP